MITELNEIGSGLQDDCMSLSKEISTEKARVDRSARSALNRGTVIFNNRALRQYLRQWHDNIALTQTKEDRSGFIIKRMRARLVKQAFQIYKKRTAELRQDLKSEERMKHFMITVEERRKRRAFNALCVYRKLFCQAKTYWSILFTKMDLWRKRRAYRTWVKNSYAVGEDSLKDQQNLQTEVLAELNHELGAATTIHNNKVIENKTLDKSLKK